MVEYSSLGTRNGDEILATDRGMRVGKITYAIRGDSCDISYIYVNSEMRRQGIATMLMLKLYEHLFSEENVDKVSIMLPHENDELEAFLEKMKFKRDDSLGCFVSFKLFDVIYNSTFSEIKPVTGNIVRPLKDVRSSTLVKALGSAVERSGFGCDAREFFSAYDTECSMILTDGDSVEGFSVIGRISQNKVIFSFLYVDPGSRGGLPLLIKATGEAVLKAYGEECEICAYPYSQEGRNLIEKLIGREKLVKEPVIGYTLSIFE